MGIVDSTDFDNICTTAEIGRALTRIVATETTDSTWGSVTTYSTTSNSVIGVLIPMSDEDILESEGKIKIGDAKCFFPVDTTMVNDNIIVDSSDNYRVTNLRTMNSGSNNVFKKCILVRQD